MKFSVALLCLGLAVSVQAGSKCGISKVSLKAPWRIIGGVPAKAQEFPWQISVKNSDGSSHNCGGTIISDQWLMTAAHCGNTPKIVLGDTDFRDKDGHEIEVEIDKWIRHPLDGGNFQNQYDVALIKMGEKLDLDGVHDYLAPICLATADDDQKFETNRCIASGWGYNDDRVLPDNLMKVELPVLTNEVCYPIFDKLGLKITERTICAGGEGVKTICNGDSGGPLQCHREDGSWVQVGITSFVKTGCGEQSPGGFARVSAFHDWILETIANE